jgi:hypothetical protein
MKNIFPTGKTLKILEESEVLHKDDLCRLVIETSSEGGFNLTYKSDGYLPLAWHKAQEEIPGWINYPIKEYKYHKYYEFARIIK